MTAKDLDATAGVDCQLRSFPVELGTGAPSREEPWSWYLKRRGRGVLYHLEREVKRLGPASDAPSKAAEQWPAADVREGDLVRVRSAGYVRRTLDAKGQYAGCAFGSGMFQYCGQELRVKRVVDQFFDEARWRMLKGRNMVLLDGVYCDGSSVRETGGCARMCFYFWRTEWLEKVE